MSEHSCHAAFCESKTPETMFMCRYHWSMLPRNFQRNVTRNYRRGQCADWKITNEYADAAQTAIWFVSVEEGYELTGEEDALKLYDMLRPENDA